MEDKKVQLSQNIYPLLEKDRLINPSQYDSTLRGESNLLSQNEVSDKQIVNEELEKPQQPNIEPGLKEKVGLIIILIISMGNQWQRYTLAYAKGIGTSNKDPKTEIATEYSQFSDYYGILAGAAFTVSFAVFGIFGGVISDRFNRRNIICLSCVLWSLCTFFSGYIDSFPLMFVLRFFLGLFEAFFGPAAYSIISDFYHPQYRTTANSVYNLGIYFGGALSSISTKMINSQGWRRTFEIIGLIGVASGITGLILIKEPVRNRFDAKKIQSVLEESPKLPQKSTLRKFIDAFLEIFINPSCRWVVIAGSFRFFGGYAIGFYMPSYFLGVYPDHKDAYTYGNAFVVSACGFLSSILGGMASDHYEKKGYLKTKATICILSGLLGIPFIVLCTLLQNNVWISLMMLGFEYLVAENWVSPAITMILNTISPSNKGYGVSAFLFFATIAGTISTYLCGLIQIKYEAKDHPERYGYILCAFVVFSYGGSIPFFILAGQQYKKAMIEKKNQEALK